MNCPICQSKIPYKFDEGTGLPYFNCLTTVEMEGSRYPEYHYVKYINYEKYYVEEAIIGAFKIINFYKNTEFQKPYCRINKYLPIKDDKRNRWGFQEVLRFPNILEILPYKRMQERLKKLLTFS